MQQSQISVIVPTLNEADNITLLFERLHETMQKAHIEYEIIVVDDHSTDATVALTRAADAKYAATALLKRGKPGKAFSLLEGFEAAKYDLVCMIDADLQYPPEAIAKMYHKMQFCNADVVITNRIDNKTSRLRKLSTGAFHLVFTRMLFGIDYDTQSGLKLFKKKVLKDMTITPSAWTFDLEFIIRALENKHTILSEDIAFAERNAGVAKINLASAAFEGAYQSVKLWRNSSVKNVKNRYRQLKPLQQSFNWVTALLIGTVFAFGVTTAQADAATDKAETPATGQRSLFDRLTDTVTSLLPIGSGTPSDDGKDTSLVTLPATPLTTKPAATPAAAATNSPAQGATQSTTAPTATTSITVPSSSGNSSSTSNTSPTPAATSTGKNFTTESGENVPYYPSSQLSSDKTSSLLSISRLALMLGAGLLLIGLLLLAIRKLIRRLHQRQHSSVHA